MVDGNMKNGLLKVAVVFQEHRWPSLGPLLCFFLRFALLKTKDLFPPDSPRSFASLLRHGNRRPRQPPFSSCRQRAASAYQNHAFPVAMNSQQEAFRRFAQQLQRASQGGGGFQGGSPRGLYTGGGLVVALIAGGLALNASLFNGTNAIPLLCFLHNELIG